MATTMTVVLVILLLLPLAETLPQDTDGYDAYALTNPKSRFGDALKRWRLAKRPPGYCPDNTCQTASECPDNCNACEEVQGGNFPNKRCKKN
uniref:Gsp_60 putative toxin n=1 Tax=Gemmula speciosa TaxID=439592 RepID=A0A098LXS5_GEMSP